MSMFRGRDHRFDPFEGWERLPTRKSADDGQNKVVPHEGPKEPDKSWAGGYIEEIGPNGHTRREIGPEEARQMLQQMHQQMERMREQMEQEFGQLLHSRGLLERFKSFGFPELPDIFGPGWFGSNSELGEESRRLLPNPQDPEDRQPPKGDPE
jgi:hypothetical protein